MRYCSPSGLSRPYSWRRASRRSAPICRTELPAMRARGSPGIIRGRKKFSVTARKSVAPYSNRRRAGPPRASARIAQGLQPLAQYGHHRVPVVAHGGAGRVGGGRHAVGDGDEPEREQGVGVLLAALALFRGEARPVEAPPFLPVKILGGGA